MKLTGCLPCPVGSSAETPLIPLWIECPIAARPAWCPPAGTRFGPPTAMCAGEVRVYALNMHVDALSDASAIECWTGEDRFWDLEGHHTTAD